MSLFALALALALFACHATERRQAKDVLVAIERLDAAGGADRERALSELMALKAELPVAERAQAACAQKHRGLISAQQLVARAKAAPLGSRALLVKAADEALRQAEAGFHDCAEAKQALRQWLKNH